MSRICSLGRAVAAARNGAGTAARKRTGWSAHAVGELKTGRMVQHSFRAASSQRHLNRMGHPFSTAAAGTVDAESGETSKKSAEAKSKGRGGRAVAGRKGEVVEEDEEEEEEQDESTEGEADADDEDADDDDDEQDDENQDEGEALLARAGGDAESGTAAGSEAASSRLQSALKPSEVVERLDRFIVGQNDAKKAVAIALRNRMRRQMLPEDLRKEVTPKNILMVGPTGCGKTEIARRMASLAEAPFLKVEATKFTEVGFHGRDVDMIVRDLVDAGILLVREKLRREKKEELEQEVRPSFATPSYIMHIHTYTHYIH